MPSPLSHHLCFRLARAARSTMGLYERRCREIGLTPMQLLVLGALQERNAVTVGELAEELGFDQTTMTRILQRMVEAKLVEQIPDPADRRIRRIYLHRDAKKMLKKWMATVQELDENLTASLSPEELAAFFQTLEKLK
ncbi:MAG: MarR family transcriptional regulator [Blastocatellia bacterium]|nr:MarR family transcriptional regulator [Blastocatellia bacterium]